MRNTSTIPQNIFIYGYSLGGSSLEQLIRLIPPFSLFFSKKKKKKNKKKKKKRKKRKIKKRKKDKTYIINQ